MRVDLLIETLHGAGYDSRLVESDTELTVRCPFCFSEDRKLYISTETGLWKCFKCDESGNLFTLLRDGLEHSPTMSFTIEHSILGGAGNRLIAWPNTPATETPEVEVELPPGCVSHVNGPEALYLESRDISPGFIERFGITFCYTGSYRYRVIVPVVTGGKMRTWIARSIHADVVPKVLNAPNSQASKALFNYDNVPIVIQNVVVVEGVFDALRMLTLGYKNVVATLGGHITDDQRRLLGGSKAASMILLRDRDTAGEESAIKDARELVAAGIPTKIAVLPKQGSDPGSATPEDIQKALDRAQVVGVDYGSEVLKQVHHTQDKR